MAMLTGQNEMNIIASQMIGQAHKVRSGQSRDQILACIDSARVNAGAPDYDAETVERETAADLFYGTLCLIVDCGVDPYTDQPLTAMAAEKLTQLAKR